MEKNSSVEHVSPLRAFLRGAGSIFNICPAPERPAFLDRSDEEALAGDWAAVGGDWAAVGGDIRAAMKKHPLPDHKDYPLPSDKASPVL